MRSPISKKRRAATRTVSVFVAIILWVFVSYTENPQIDTTLNAIPIQITGEKTLEDRGLMMVNKASVPEGSLTIRGRRRDLMSVMGNITASADISHITTPGIYRLKPLYDIPSNAVYTTKRNTNHIDVEIEKIIYKTLDIKVITQNQEKNKAFIVEPVPEIQSITIGGAYDDVKSIDHASVYVDVGTMLNDNTDSYKIVYEDNNGAQVLLINNIYCETDEISVNNYIYDKKILDIQINVPSNLSDTHLFKILGQSAQTVEVGIKEEKAKKIKSISSTKDAFYNIVSQTGKYMIPLDIPEGIYVPEKNREVEVEIEVLEIGKAQVSVPVSVRNTSGKKYIINQKSVNVMISGPVEMLKSDNITAELDIDMISSQPGVYNQRVNIKSKDENVKITSDAIYIEVTIN